MVDLEHLVATYEVAVNGPDDDARAAAHVALAEDVVFTGPLLGVARGRQAVIEMMATMRADTADDPLAIERTTAIDEHNGWIRFGWRFINDRRASVATGMDVANVSDEGRLSTVVAFFGDLPPR